MATNIIMLMKDRAALTLQALNSLYKNTDSADFNLTLVDDDSHPDVRGMISDWISLPVHDNCTMLQITRGRSITGQARNLGVYWSEKIFGRGEFLYLSDNDVFFTPDWASVLIEALERVPGFKLIGGSTHPYHGWDMSIQAGLSTRVISVRNHDAVSGYSQMMRWETWDKYGPLDAHAAGVGQSEDFKFCQQIVKDGGRVGSVWPEVVYACGLTNTFGEPSIGADKMTRYPGILQR